MRARPIADSAAATVNIKKENMCPYMSSKELDTTKKFKFIAKSIISIHINTIIIYRLFKRMPNNAIKNIQKLTKS